MNDDLDAYAGQRGNQIPRVANYPVYARSSKAEEIIDLMDGLRVPLDPWQQFVLRNGLGENPTPDLSGYEWAADRCGCWVPRQNGKGNIIMALELGWLYLFNERLVVHSAHEYKTAQEAYLRIRDLCQGNPDLDKLVARYWAANGEQGIELKKNKKTGIGPRLRFMARTRSAGRGFSAPKLILDEAQELIEGQMRAIMPVLSSFINWQVWFFGTPPQPDVEGGTVSSAWIYNLKEAGEKRRPRVAWFDFGIPTLDLTDPEQVAILEDPATWLATNPALNRPSKSNSMQLQTIQGELDIMTPGQGFAMERCGMWLPRATTTTERTIDPEAWREGKVEKERPADLAIAFYVNPKRNHATIGWAGKLDGLWRVGIFAHKQGTGWLLDKLVELIEKYKPVAVTVDAKSETTLDDLAERGIRVPEVAEEPKRGELFLPTMPDVATAYGLFVDSANNGELRHHGQTPLDNAIQAPARPLGGGSTWDHKHGIEVGPAVCVQLAMLAYRERIDKIRDEYDPLDNIW